MKRDIENREDIDRLVAEFYAKVMTDDVIGYIFTDVARIDLQKHLPVVADFWDMVVFRNVNFVEKYGRTPMQKHVELDEKSALEPEHFQRWMMHFQETVDSLFAGPRASMVLERAESVLFAMMRNVISRRAPGVPVPE